MSAFIYFIIGVLATIIFGWLFYYLTMKRSKIVHSTNNFLNIGKGLTESYPDYHLYYKDKKIKNNVMILEGTFTNTGRDISITNDNRVIVLILPEGSIYLDSNIVSSSEGLWVDIVKNEVVKTRLQNTVSGDLPIATNNKIPFVINYGLLKSKEFFKYSIIFETPIIYNSIDQKLNFDYRIKNTDIIVTKEDRTKQEVISTLLIFVFSAILVILLDVRTMEFFFYYVFLPINITYLILLVYNIYKKIKNHYKKKL